MIPQLTYLMDEICAGVEIYYTGRTGGQYLKTAFILCDDYTELVSKLYLLTDNPRWSDQRANNSFKNYHDILSDVDGVVAGKSPAHLSRIQELHTAMKNRRTRRNDFFHSTSLLDLSVTQRNCIESFCDLFEYGENILGSDWCTAVGAARNLETLCVLLQIEKRALSDPTVNPKANKIIQDWPRNLTTKRRSGVHLSEYPEDLHLRLCIICGGNELLEKLKALLT